MKNMIHTYISLFVFSIFIVGCSGDNDAEETNSQGEHVENVDSTMNDQDSSMIEEIDTASNEEYVSEEDEMEKLNEEHKQLTFCDCVKKQKELDDAMELEEDDAKLMDILDEMERLVNEECKVLTVGPNRTPDERAAHKRKVRKCLGS